MNPFEETRDTDIDQLRFTPVRTLRCPTHEVSEEEPTQANKITQRQRDEANEALRIEEWLKQYGDLRYDMNDTGSVFLELPDGWLSVGGGTRIESMRQLFQDFCERLEAKEEAGRQARAILKGKPF